MINLKIMRVRLCQPLATVPERLPLTLADRIEGMGRALTAQELARILNVSKITIFKQAKARRIPSFRVGTCVPSTRER